MNNDFNSVAFSLFPREKRKKFEAEAAFMRNIEEAAAMWRVWTRTHIVESDVLHLLKIIYKKNNFEEFKYDSLTSFRMSCRKVLAYKAVEEKDIRALKMVLEFYDNWDVTKDGASKDAESKMKDFTKNLFEENPDLENKIFDNGE